MIDPSCIWIDGELLGADDAPSAARDPANTVAVELMHCTETPRGTAVFRLRDHLERFLALVEMAGVEGYPHTPGKLFQAVHRVIHANGCLRCQVQIQLVWEGARQPASKPVTIISMRRGEGHRTSAMQKGVKASYTDLEVSAEVLWIENGTLYAAEPGAHPASIARDSLITLAEDAGMQVAHAPLDRGRLLGAEEVLLVKPSIDVVPVIAIDGQPVGSAKPGPLTLALRESLESAAHGGKGSLHTWLETMDETIYAV